MANTFLITGINGYIGSSIVQKLLNKKEKIIGVTRNPLTANIGRLDVRLIDWDNLDEILISQKIDYIIHASCSYGRNGESKDEIYLANYYQPKKILERINSTELPNFININTVISPEINNYSKSKYMFSNELTKFYLNKGKNNFLDLFLQNIYGPEEKEDKIVKSLFNSLSSNQEIIIRNPSYSRDFLFIDDLAEIVERAIYKISSLSDISQKYKVGFGKETTISELVQILSRLLNSKSKINFLENSIKEERINLDDMPDLFHELNTKPKYNLKAGLLKYIS